MPSNLTEDCVGSKNMHLYVQICVAQPKCKKLLLAFILIYLGFNVAFSTLFRLCGCSTTRLRLPIKGFGGSVAKICLVPGVL